MKRSIRILIAVPGAILTLAAMLQGIPEYTNREKVGCEFCHTGVGKADLNDAGRYYEKHHTLRGYTPKKKLQDN
ncbi:MAG TPA: hypothetical protein VFY29_19280 [Terriglobia bacterium]|nr:hypothetical protein [Terriglobia bacterium]